MLILRVRLVFNFAIRGRRVLLQVGVLGNFGAKNKSVCLDSPHAVQRAQLVLSRQRNLLIHGTP